MHFAERMDRLGTETAFEVLARARKLEEEGRNVIHLEIGEPDFDTPEHIRNAAKQALDEGYTHYGPAAGLPELRDAIAEEVERTRGVPTNRDQVVVTPGAKPIMFFSILACVDERDEVLYPNPGFPIYESVIRFVGARPVPIPLLEEKGFSFAVEDLRERISPKTRMIILNSPGNPTGGVLPKSDLEAIAELAVENDAIVLSDEVYGRILYEGEHHSILSLPGMQERTILLDGFSKTYAMTGWRLGYGVMPEDLAGEIVRLMVNSNSCTSTFVQRAGIAALQGPQDGIHRMIEAFRKRRSLVVEGLNRIEGVRCLNPPGAFYAFPNIRETGRTSEELEEYLLEHAGVACLAGTSFGEHGDGYLRFSYANSLENLREALNRIERALAEL